MEHADRDMWATETQCRYKGSEHLQTPPATLMTPEDWLSIPEIWGKRPPTQIIMAGLIKANSELNQAFFICVYRLPLPNLRFKRSALDMEKASLS